jgi:hypothetical protein
MIMKKLGILLGLFFYGVSCFAQSNNDAQRIIGTWRNTQNELIVTYTFNANGTFVFQFRDYSPSNGNYFISDSKLIIAYNSGGTAEVYEFYIFPNGRILVFGDRRYDKQ